MIILRVKNPHNGYCRQSQTFPDEQIGRVLLEQHGLLIEVEHTPTPQPTPRIDEALFIRGIAAGLRAAADSFERGELY